MSFCCFVIQALVVQDVSVFVARLSNATVQHHQEITQSPVTVRTIVGILVHIAEISQNITINKPVMEVCNYFQCFSYANVMFTGSFLLLLHFIYRISLKQSTYLCPINQEKHGGS